MQKFFCLMFPVAGAREQTLHGDATRGGAVRGRAGGALNGRKTSRRRPLESRSCGDPFLLEGRRAALRGRRTF